MHQWAQENGLTPENGYPDEDADLFEFYSAFVYTNEFLQGEIKPLTSMVISDTEYGLDSAAVFVNGKYVADPSELEETLNEGNANRVKTIFIQAKSSEGFKQPMTARFINQVKTIADAATELGSSKFEGNLYRIASLIHAIIQNIGRFETAQIPCSLYYVTTAGHDGTRGALQDPQVADQLKLLEALGIFETVSTPREFSDVWGYPEIIDFRAHGHQQLWQKFRASTAPQKVQFKWDRQQTIPTPNVEESASIGVIPASELLKIISEDGRLRSNIFDENVRQYQGNDNPVNTEIAKTLQSERRSQFAYLNNGVTLITREMSTISDLVTLNDYQVVNGGQTSHTIYNWATSEAREDLAEQLQNTWIPIKVIQSPDRSTLRDVTLATNNQTQVTEFEKRATSPKAKSVEEYFSQSGLGGLRYKRQSGVAKMDTVRAKVSETAELTRITAAVAYGHSAAATRAKKEVDDKLGDLIWAEGNPEGMFYVSAYISYRIDAFFNRNRNNDFAKISISRYHIAMLTALILEPALANIYEKNPNDVRARDFKSIELFQDPASVADLEKRIDGTIESAAEIVYSFFGDVVSDGKSLVKDQVRRNYVQTDLVEFYKGVNARHFLGEALE